MNFVRRFVKEYFNDPRRGYGANVSEVFQKLNNQNLEDVWTPAAEQFNGSGSYGNGGAMRISPVPLFAHKNYDIMIHIAEQSTKLTHTHPLGINGAILQVRIVKTFHFNFLSNHRNENNRISRCRLSPSS